MLLRDIREEKAAIRSKCRLLRSQFTAEEKKSLDARIFNRLAVQGVRYASDLCLE